LIHVGFEYGDGDEFFLWEWDSETCRRPVAIPNPY